MSENVGEFHHCKNLKFENFGEPQLKMMSPELLLASCKDLWSSIVPSTYGTVCLMQLYVIKFITTAFSTLGPFILKCMGLQFLSFIMCQGSLCENFKQIRQLKQK
jgi:hypothetical protein